MMQAIDTHSINSISFTPSSEQIRLLIEKSHEAYRDIHNKDRTSNLSKLWCVDGEKGLLPTSINPDDTILCKLGRRFGKIWSDKKYFTIIDDQKMPFAGSNGPNGLLLNCNSMEYGLSRINLFNYSIEDTGALLTDYLDFRNSNINDIFAMFYKKLESHKSSFEIILGQPENTLPIEQRENYRSTCDMFKCVADMLKTGKTLEWCGIGCVSYCQTWIKNSPTIVADTQFSVMSPHFQTRFYVADDEKLITRCKLSKDMISGYINMIKYFTENMKMYGTIDGNQCFINCDSLLKELII